MSGQRRMWKRPHWEERATQISTAGSHGSSQNPDRNTTFDIWNGKLYQFWGTEKSSIVVFVGFFFVKKQCVSHNGHVIWLFWLTFLNESRMITEWQKEDCIKSDAGLKAIHCWSISTFFYWSWFFHHRSQYLDLTDAHTNIVIVRWL